MNEKIKNILIIGTGARVESLARKLRQYEGVEEIYAAPGNSFSSSNYKNIDIREDDMTGLLKFSLENNIDLTVPVSEKSLNADVVTFFTENGQNIFGPSFEACNIALDNAAGKKFLYKIHAQTSKFGIFDKPQPAEDYLRNANFPITIKSGKYSEAQEDLLVCSTISLAREFLSVLFSKNETDILIEEFTYGQNFTVYFITDGYSALPITSVANYKFMQDGDSGIYTNGIGCYAPDYKISQLVISRVENIVKNTLTLLANRNCPYNGILGVECVLTGEDKFMVNGFKPFLQEHDISAVLNLIDDNLIDIFMSCINGFFADEYENLMINNLSSVSATVLSRQFNKQIKGLENLEDINNVDFIDVKSTNNDIYLTGKGAVMCINRTASTLSRAKKYLYEDLSQLNFEGIKYRKDIAEYII